MRYFLISLLIFLIGCNHDGSKNIHSSDDINETNRTVETNTTEEINNSVANIYEKEPLFYQAWHMEYNENYAKMYNIAINADINISGAFKYASGKGVKIAIIDDGFEMEHEDIRDGIIFTFNANDESNNVEYDNSRESHGLQCAGIIGARVNGKGITGIAPNSELILIKEAVGDSASILKALKEAESLGARVISNSWGTYHVDSSIKDELNRLANKGIIILFASGNDKYNLDNSNYDDESEVDGVIGVSASDEEAQLSSYSNYGSKIDILAPGGSYSLGIVTTDISGQSKGVNQSALYPNYIEAQDPDSFIGTSAAAPVVAGVVALMLEVNPNLTKDKVLEIFRATNNKIGNVEYNGNGFNIKYAYGKINAGYAVKMAKERDGY